MHIIAAKAVAFEEALQPSFKEYSKQIVANAKALADELLSLDYHLVSGGTDNHLINVDVMSRGKTGAEVQELLDMANITANKNAIPFDTLPVRQTSGMRFGTPAVTTRGMKEAEMREIGGMIVQLLRGGSEATDEVRRHTIELCRRFPIYG